MKPAAAVSSTAPLVACFSPRIPVAPVIRIPLDALANYVKVRALWFRFRDLSGLDIDL